MATTTLVTATAEQLQAAQLRTYWHDPAEPLTQPGVGCILLSTGGPALRLLVELDCDAQACGVMLGYQDWGTPWTRFPITGAEEEALEWFAGLFWFGEG